MSLSLATAVSKPGTTKWWPFFVHDHETGHSSSARFCSRLEMVLVNAMARDLLSKCCYGRVGAILRSKVACTSLGALAFCVCWKGKNRRPE